MQLVIVESPAKAHTISKYLGKNYSVVSSYGHVRDIPSKEGAVLPEQDFAIDYEINPAAQKHVKAIVDAAKKADGIIIASDPDREGEAIAWHIAEILKAKRIAKKDLPIKRVVFHEITKRAVTEAMGQPRDINIDLVNAQQARRALDYLVGFTLSPILWRKLPGSRSAGRVQSVALRIICDREAEIEKFISQEYWTVECKFEGEKKEHFLSQLIAINGNKLDKFDLNNKEPVDKVCEELTKRQFAVQSVQKKQQFRNPYPPFITSTLQQEASRKLGFGAKKTMQIAQRLYEGVDIDGDRVALITYMRTDGVNLAAEAVTQARDYIQKKFGQPYLPKDARMYKTKVRNAQEAHEAIRPIDVFLTPESLHGKLEHDQWKLYDLIWKRMLACQMSSVILDQVHVLIASSDGYAELKSTGSTIAFDGFYRVYREQTEDSSDNQDKESTLPVLEAGEALSLLETLPEQHFTEPPPRYSEASLVKQLEELGIGRPSTYASIISVLQDRGYVRLENKRFIPEERGKIVTAFLVNFFKKYVEYDFTARLEDELDYISNGEMAWKEFLKLFWNEFEPQAAEVMNQDKETIVEAVSETFEKEAFPDEESRKCPTCGAELKMKVSKFGPFVGCSAYPKCKYTRSLANNSETNATVEPHVLGFDPETNKKVLLKKGPYGFYLQREDGEGKKKEKKYSVPKEINPENLNLDYALKLMSLPRNVCMHPVTGMAIKAGLGRFGPYLLYNGQYSRLKELNQLFDISDEDAIKLVDQNAKFNGSVLGQYEGQDISLHKGRFGAYIKIGEKNIRIPKGADFDNFGCAEALKLIRSGWNKKSKKK